MYPLEYNPVLSDAGHCQSRYAGFFRDYMEWVRQLYRDMHIVTATLHRYVNVSIIESQLAAYFSQRN